jgi:predicted nicotinamide N-methyase
MTMPGYRTKLESIAIAGVGNLFIRSLLDRQQYYDPDGAAERLGIGPAVWPLFGLLWPSALHLAAQLALRPVCANEKILEIGCGLGLASLVGHRRGARITASDCHPLAGDFLRENLLLNDLCASLRYKHGQWGETGPESVLDAGRAQLSSRYDLIIGSDLLYDRDMPAELAAFIDRHAVDDAEVWVVDPNRGHRPAFNRSMAALGFALYQDMQLSNLPPQLVDGPAALYKGRMLVYRR